MTTDTVERVTVDSAIADKLLGWIGAGRGVRRWVSEEIGNTRPDMFTPADNETPPHWAYPLTSSQVLDPALVDAEQLVERARFRGRLKRFYWGTWLAPATEAKAQRLCRDGESFWWEYDGYGLANVFIGPKIVSPLIAASANNVV